MNVDTMKNIAELIPLGTAKKITGHKMSRLTAPGQNYGSLMLSLDITVQTPTENEEIHLVAKTVPPNEYIQELFNTPVTFRNEIEFYKTIAPTLRDFQNEHRIQKVADFFPKYYGSRLNLSGGETVDQDAVLVLENLKVANYDNLDRMKGFDLDVARLVIANLARLHAVSLGLKLQKLEVFQKQVMPYMSRWYPNKPYLRTIEKHLHVLTDTVDELKPWKERIFAGFEIQKTPPEPREPFATVAHNDCWVNNIMIRFEGTKAADSKLVDFQVCSYESPAKDIVFFLFSSVKNQVLVKHYDDLVKLYHQIFISVLEELGCDTKPFTFEALEQELDFEARRTQFGHLVFMVFPIFADNKAVPDVSEFNTDNMMTEEPSEFVKEKLVFIVREFVKRNWI